MHLVLSCCPEVFTLLQELILMNLTLYFVDLHIWGLIRGNVPLALIIWVKLLLILMLNRGSLLILCTLIYEAFIIPTSLIDWLICLCGLSYTKLMWNLLLLNASLSLLLKLLILNLLLLLLKNWLILGLDLSLILLSELLLWLILLLLLLMIYCLLGNTLLDLRTLRLDKLCSSKHVLLLLSSLLLGWWLNRIVLKVMLIMQCLLTDSNLMLLRGTWWLILWGLEWRRFYFWHGWRLSTVTRLLRLLL